MSLVNKSMFSLVPQHEYMTLPRLLLRYLLRGATDGTERDGQTDTQTDVRPFHRSCSAWYAGSINKQIDRVMGRKLCLCQAVAAVCLVNGHVNCRGRPVQFRRHFVPMLSAVFLRCDVMLARYMLLSCASLSVRG